MHMRLLAIYAKLDGALAVAGAGVQSVLLLLIRLWWGWSFFLTGKGKLMNLGRTTEFFASLDIPLPQLNAMLAGGVECVGGLLLLLGLFSRAVTVPLIFTMIVAFATADREALQAIVSDTDKFTSAAPFLFLLASLVVFVFGPGKLSLDALFFKKPAAK
jgi:putative oxidoreductase